MMLSYHHCHLVFLVLTKLCKALGKVFCVKESKTETQKLVSIDRLKAYFVLPDQMQTSTSMTKPDEEPPPSSSSEAKPKG